MASPRTPELLSAPTSLHDSSLTHTPTSLLTATTTPEMSPLTPAQYSPISTTTTTPQDSSSMPSLTIPPNAKRHAMLAVRALNRRARALAERDYAHDPKRRTEAPAVSHVDMKKRMRNRSAFISRQASRHYEKLLVEHVKNGEQERDRAVAQVAKVVGEVECLRMLVATLEAQQTERDTFDACLLDDVITTSPAY